MNPLSILTVYTRIGCHLCEKMIQELEVYQQQHVFSINIVDVDMTPALKQQYGEYVPVLAVGEKEICHFFLNHEHLLTHFRSTELT